MGRCRIPERSVRNRDPADRTHPGHRRRVLGDDDVASVPESVPCRGGDQAARGRRGDPARRGARPRVRDRHGDSPGRAPARPHGYAAAALAARPVGRLTTGRSGPPRRLLLPAASIALALLVLLPTGALAARAWTISPTSVSLAGG